MAYRVKTAIMLALMGLCITLSQVATAALSTNDLIRLKAAGLSEDVIRLMVESGYDNVNRVITLKEAGFKDETILVIIKTDLKEGATVSAPTTRSETGANAEVVNVKTTAKVKIEWYLLYRGGAVLQNSDEFDAATVSVLGGKTLKLEWADKRGLGMLDLFFKKAFKSPFYWDLGKDDLLLSGKDGYSYVLRSASGHKGKPDTDDSHYWVVYLQPNSPRVVDYIKDVVKGN